MQTPPAPLKIHAFRERRLRQLLTYQVRLWDLSTRTLVGLLGEEFDAPAPASFSPDSRILAFKTVGGGPTNRIVLYDLAKRAVSLELIATNFLGPQVFVPGKLELINGVMLGPDFTRGLVLWDLKSRRVKASAVLTTKGGELYAGNDFRITADGNLGLLGDIDGMVKFWNTRGLEFLGAIRAHDGGISALALSPDGRLVATAQAYSGTAIKLWDFERAFKAAQVGTTPQPLALLEGHESWVRSLSFSTDGLLLASGSVDHSIRLWDVRSRKEKRKLQGHENEVISVRFAPGGRLYSSGYDGLVCAWSLMSPPRRIGPERRSLMLSGMSLSPDGRSLAVVHTNGAASLFDVGTGDRLNDFPGTNSQMVMHSASGRLLYVAKQSGEIVVWHAQEKRAVRQLPGKAGARFCQASMDGRLLVVVDRANQITVWEVSTWLEKASWRHEGINSCALSPDATLLATGHGKGLVQLWDPWTGKPRCTVTHMKEETTALAFSPDGRLLAAASGAGPVTIWEMVSLRAYPPLSGHPHLVSSLAFSADGRRLATGSRDKDAVKLWDTATWRELLTLEAPGGYLWELTFSPDRNRIMACSEANDLLIWNARPFSETTDSADTNQARAKLEWP